ncbi:MAG: methyltransferase domain-containing protein [bacterium]
MHNGREFYEKEYHYDEDVVVLDNKRIHHFFKQIKFSEVKRYLDIGCGVGWALKYCSERGLECVGFDIAERPIRLSRDIVSPRINTMVANGEKLPFPARHFDLVSSLGTIEHFTSPSQGLKEITRVTRKGGQVLLVVPNSYWILNKLTFYKGTEQPQEMLATSGQWIRFFNQHNLKVEKISRDIGPKVFKNRNPLGIIKRLLLKFTLIMPLAFAYQFIFVCKRQ